ncbi:sensor histidine kinase DpiB [Desulfosporosinus acididurans]|uniref:Sensor histidine kinase DpiB n=1 Tax=Desulfosporosinus acididurans TaxID=476652 RepID=A0A0J1FPA7_9FIRM|nr:ATP-binding protein [Desulfosporosinus acididurans]KLU65147.1 sensor histidine kinase DpiB [Desulfosporosinus acididurans]
MNSKVLGDLIASILECIIYLSSAEIFLSNKIKDVKPLIPKIFSFAIIYGFYDTLTFQFWDMLDLNHLRILTNILVSFILLKLILKTRFWSTMKFLIFYWFFGCLSQIIILYALMAVLKLTTNNIINNPLLLIKVALFESFSIIIPLSLHKFRIPIVTFLKKINIFMNYQRISSVTIAILLQLFLLSALIFDYTNNLTYDVNPLRFLIIILINIFIILVSLFILFRTISKTEEKVIAVSSDIMTDNLASLLNSVRSQRHDFINHVQIINSLFSAHDLDGLDAYLRQLTNDIVILNNVLKIDNPFIGALLNSKITKAESKGIDLQIEITAKLSNLQARAFDLTRILDNIINNAIEAIELNKQDEKWIKVFIKEQGPFLSVSVINPGSPPTEIEERLFEPGYTTKTGEHSGLGLYICKLLCKKLHGKLNYSITPGTETIFSIVIPKL